MGGRGSSARRLARALYGRAPAFPVSAGCAKVLYGPLELHEALTELARGAKERLVMATLYTAGSGKKEQDFLSAIREATERNPAMEARAIVDARRAARGKGEGVQALRKSGMQVTGFSPESGWMTKALPQAWREGIAGVMHGKCLVADDTVLVTGANFAEKYFTERIDRSMLIHCRALADWFHSFVACVSSSSATGRGIEHSLAPLAQPSAFHKSNAPTVVFPCIQAGFSGIRQEESAFPAALGSCSLSSDAEVVCSSAYVNPSPWLETALARCQASQLSFIIPSEESHGFSGAHGAKRVIPSAYEATSWSFLRRVERKRDWCGLSTRGSLWRLKSAQGNNLQLHAKGLWHYESEEEVPRWCTIGSSNFAHRSSERDLEVNLFVGTEDASLRAQMGREASMIASGCQGYVRPSQAELPRLAQRLAGSALSRFL